MLTVKQLLAYSQSPPKRQDRTRAPNLISNAGSVGISFGKVTEGQDARGFYRSIVGRALSSGTGKRQKTFEIRLYYPKTRAKEDQYVPINVRKKGEKYLGPEKAPAMTVAAPAWVSCNCEYFLYHCEVADAEQDNSSIKFSNGKFPKITNAQGVPHLCKHLIAALRKGALLKK